MSKLFSEAIKLCLIATCLLSSDGLSFNSTDKPDFNRLADAIRLAEGNSNYGVLKHYKHTSYRQACINTCTHAYRDWLKVSPRGYNAKLPYLQFLRDRYCPLNAKNDPKHLNYNWLRSVSYLYQKGKR